MARRGNKTSVVCWLCGTCKVQTGHGFLNTATHGKKIERNRYCPNCMSHTPQFTKLESSGSKGLARNK